MILLGSTSPGGVQALITGGTPTPGPLDGTDFAQRNADGSWGTPINTGLTECGTCSSAVSAIALPDGQTPMFVNNYGGSAVVFRGEDRSRRRHGNRSRDRLRRGRRPAGELPDIRP